MNVIEEKTMTDIVTEKVGVDGAMVFACVATSLLLIVAIAACLYVCISKNNSIAKLWSKDSRVKDDAEA